MEGSLATFESLPYIPTIALKTAQWRNFIRLPRCFRTCCQYCTHTRRRRKVTTDLLCQQVPARCRNPIQPIGKICLGSYHSHSKVATLLSKPSHHCLNHIPTKEHVHKLELSEWLTKWMVELVEHHIDYQPHMEIKSQVLVDFITDFL